MFTSSPQSYAPTIVSFDTALLTGWYQAKQSNSQLAAFRAANGGVNSQVQHAPDTSVLPPWDYRVDQPKFDERLRKALAGGSIFGTGDPFFKQDMPADQRDLFKSYKALLRLQTIAEFAADKTTFSGRLPGLDTRFQVGLTELTSFVSDLDVASFMLSNGVVDSKVDTSVAIPKPLTSWTGRVIQSGAFDAAIPGLVGNEVFTISALKSGVTTDVTIDLSLVTGTLNLDNIATYVNQELSAAGIFSTIKRERIYDKVAFDAAQDPLNPTALPSTFGFKIEGVSTETLSFSAAAGQPAIYLTGTSGTRDTEMGQLLKLTDIAGGTPTNSGGDRINPELETATANAVASVLDSKGHVYVLGNTDADLGTFVNQGAQDMYLRKYDSTGTLIWEQLLGATNTAEGFGLAVDASDNVVVVGTVQGDLSATAIGGGQDTFVTKYDSTGQELFTRQRAPTANDGARDVTIAADGSIFITGYTDAALAATETYNGGRDGYITKLDTNGNLVWDRQFGAGTDEIGDAITVDANGDVFVASTENGNIMVTKYSGADDTSAALWQTNLGAVGIGGIGGITIDGTSVYVVGSTDQTAFGASQLTAHSGDVEDGFIVKITDGGASGTVDFTTFVAGGADDRIHDVTVSNGLIYVAGETRGDLNGGAFTDNVNGFVAEFDAAGTRNWAYQYSGHGGNSTAQSIVVDATGSSVLDTLGLLSGEIEYGHANTITANSTVRAGQSFRISVDGAYGKKITIDADETFRSLTFKINAVLLLDGKATVRKTADGDVLHIAANQGIRVDLIAGADGEDALAGLGIKVATVYNGGSLLDSAAVQATTTPTFGLGLESGINLTSQTDAAYTLEILNGALKKVRDIYREITKDPALDALLKAGKKTSGPVPAYLTARLANYQAGLSRLLAGSTTSIFG